MADGCTVLYSVDPIFSRKDMLKVSTGVGVWGVWKQMPVGYRSTAVVPNLRTMQVMLLISKENHLFLI